MYSIKAISRVENIQKKIDFHIVEEVINERLPIMKNATKQALAN